MFFPRLTSAGFFYLRLRPKASADVSITSRIQGLLGRAQLPASTSSCNESCASVAAIASVHPGTPPTAPPFRPRLRSRLSSTSSLSSSLSAAHKMPAPHAATSPPGSYSNTPRSASGAIGSSSAGDNSHPIASNYYHFPSAPVAIVHRVSLNLKKKTPTNSLLLTNSFRNSPRATAPAPCRPGLRITLGFGAFVAYSRKC